MQLRPRLTTALATAALLAAACGGGAANTLDASGDPKGALVAAFQNSQQERATLTFRLDSDVSSLRALAGDAGAVLSRDIAEVILDSSLSVSGDPGEDAADPADDEFEVSLVIGGDRLVEMRVVDAEAYLRVDVRGLFERFDRSGTGLDQLEFALAQMGSQPGLEFVGPAVDGAWIHLEGMQEMGDFFADLGGQPQIDDEELASLESELMQLFEATLAEDVEVSYIGSEDAGDRVRASMTGGALFDFLDQMFDVMGPSLTSSLGRGIDPRLALEEMRAEFGAGADSFVLPIDVWIRGDRVSQVGFDLVAFTTENVGLFGRDTLSSGVDRLTVLFEIHDFSGGIDKPGDSVSVNLLELLTQFGLADALGAGLAT